MFLQQLINFCKSIYSNYGGKLKEDKYRQQKKCVTLKVKN